MTEGEYQKRKAQIDNTTRQLTQHGMSPEQAKSKAVEAAHRADRREEKKR